MAKNKELKKLIKKIRAEAKTLWQINKKHHTMNPKCIMLADFEEIVKEMET